MVIGETGPTVEVAVIGGGPGGYSAAIRAAELGRDVMLIEREALGGVCLNHGCIPSKALISAARVAAAARAGERRGIKATVAVDAAGVQAWKARVVRRLTEGVEGLLKRHGVRVARGGTARFSAPRRLVIELPDGFEHVDFHDVIIATGSLPQPYPGLPFDGAKVLSPEQALSLDRLPSTMAVLGGGYIGLEIATAFARLGTRVTLLEAASRVLPEVDGTLAGVVLRETRSLGVEVSMGVTAVRPDGAGLAVEAGGARTRVEAEVVVCATGRIPNTSDLGAQATGLKPDAAGYVTVDEQQRAVEHVFAVGDVTPGPPLAHRAYAQGRVAAEAIAGQRSAFAPQVIPFIAFTQPEVMSAGLTERQAAERGMQVVTARFPMGASGRAQTLEESAGYLQLVAEKESRTVIGVQAVGPRVTELAGEAALAIEMAATLDDLALTIHPHPTISESFAEASWLALGSPLHIFRASEQGA